MLWQAEDFESLGDGFFHPATELGSTLLILLDEGFKSGFCVLASVSIEDRAYVSGDRFAHIEFWHISLCILLEVELASLPGRGIEDGFECGAD